MITMEKIDYVMSVTGCNYEVVRAALLETDGDVDLAIKHIHNMGEGGKYVGEVVDEDEQGAKGDKKAWKDFYNQVDNFANEVMEAIKEIWEKGNASRLVVEKDGQTILSLSLAISAIGVILAPVAAILGLSAVVLAKYDFKIFMDNGDVIDLKEYIYNKKNKANKDKEEKPEE